MKNKVTKNMINADSFEFAFISTSGLPFNIENSLYKKYHFNSLTYNEKNHFIEGCKYYFNKYGLPNNAVSIGFVPGGTSNGKTGDTSDIVFYNSSKEIIDRISLKNGDKSSNKTIKNITPNVNDNITDMIFNWSKLIGIKEKSNPYYFETVKDKISPFILKNYGRPVCLIKQEEKYNLYYEYLKIFIEYIILAAPNGVIANFFRTEKTIHLNKDGTISVIKAITPFGNIKVDNIYRSTTLPHCNLFIGDYYYDLGCKFCTTNVKDTLRIFVNV
jgi:hypothetical protein